VFKLFERGKIMSSVFETDVIAVYLNSSRGSEKVHLRESHYDGNVID